ncbi:MAG TPA: UDP-glucose/GDP-mannose dehydrogenase family protein [Methanotrichaceae archaeon]|nr:UDP-glucose/GDP-mannose dehydrogenase family protein [Methanotrichaceae archaeon]
MRVSIVGGGYVGLVSSICLAELGHSIDLIEIDAGRANAINSGNSPIYENGLEYLLSKHAGKSLRTRTDYGGVAGSELVFICVGTPKTESGSADLSMVESASRSIGRALQDDTGHHVVAVKSTVPPGTTQSCVMPAVLEESHRDDGAIGFAVNPEFLREGRAVHDFMHPDRIVIGSRDKAAGDLIESVYLGIDAPVLRTDLTSAEMIKYASNAFLATKISFSNEIGNICKRLGIDVHGVMSGIGMDSRIGTSFLNAGAGFGGSCLPKDISALIRIADDLGENPAILRSVQEVNDRQPLRMVELLEKRAGNLSGKTVAVLGLAFKNDTDDVRESRAIPVIEALRQRGAEVRAYDPVAAGCMGRIFPDIEYCTSAREALSGSDACLIMTEWPEFRELDKEFDLMRARVIIEGRKMLRCRGVEGICW